MAACEWTLNTSCCAGWDAYDPAVQANATAWATEILDSLTGRRFDQCPVTVRPCGPRCDWFSGYMTFPVDGVGIGGVGRPWMVPWIDNGVWRNCGCTGGCSCQAACQVPLPTPVASVVEVSLGGLILDPSAYRVDNGRILTRIDGGECWPSCQDMGLPEGDPGVFSVEYRPGEPLPLAGQIAAGELACEFAKACVGALDCQLPQQLASLSRNGVEVQIVDPNLLVDSGLTGIANVDLWIRSVNPGRKQQRSRVLSGDVRTPRRIG